MSRILAKRTLFTSAANRFSAAAAGGHSAHTGGKDLWKKLSFFGALPSVGILMVYVYLEHTAHHHDEKPEYIPYDYLRKRDKRYPWGDGTRTLFHNPHANWHPDEQDH